MIANRELLARLRDARKSMTPERAAASISVEKRYVDACQLSCGPDASRSAYWEKRATEEKLTLYGFLRPEDQPEPAPSIEAIDPMETKTEVVSGGHSWY